MAASLPGPKIQMPPAVGQLFDYQYGPDGKSIIGITMSQSLASFFNVAQQILYNSTRNGNTASRPTSTTPGRWIGMPYYDTSVSSTVFLAKVGPDVWRNGAGTIV